MVMNNLNILIVDDDQQITHTLADIFSVKGFTTTAVASAADALYQLTLSAYDCVLTDIRMPEMDGVQLFLQIHKRYPALPVVFMTAYASERLVQQGLDAGATGMLEKPLNINQLLSFFARLPKGHVLTILDDDPAFCRTVGDILAEYGYTVRAITDPHVPVKELVESSQVLLVDMKLNSINGYDILRAVRREYPDLPVVLITGFRQEMAPAIESALAIHPSACLYKPLDLPGLLNTLTDLHAQHNKALWQVA